MLRARNGWRQTRRPGSHAAASQAAAALLALLGVTSGCAADEEASCRPVLCSAADNKCVGNSAATCAADGVSFQYSACGAGGQYCAGAGVCQPRACLEPGRGLACVDASTARVCAGDGSQEATRACGSSETCDAGVCVPTSCSGEGTTSCADGYTLLTCVGGSWSVTACAAGQGCALRSGAAGCGARICAPEGARCDGARSVVCDASGTIETPTACGSGEVCKAGYCQPAVCGLDDTADASLGGSTGADAGAGVDGGATADTVVAATSKLTFRLNGTAQTFDLDAKATWDKTSRELVISGERGTKSLALLLRPIDFDGTGSWTETSSAVTGTGATICYDSGAAASGVTVGKCSDDFTHAGTRLSISITVNDGSSGGRVKGTFEASLEDSSGASATITDGVFDVAIR